MTRDIILRQEDQASSNLAPRGHSVFARAYEYMSAHYGLALFLVCFVLPTACAALFWGLIASDRYISETRFIVRSVDRPAVEGVTAALQQFGIRRTNDDAYAVQDYFLSRDAMQAMMLSLNLRKFYADPDADFFTRYRARGSSDTNEAFFRYFKKQLSIYRDVETGITTVRVSAYKAADARAIAETLLRLGEERINEMNKRAHEDAVASARQNMINATNEMVLANVILTNYRNSSQTVDPEQSAGDTQDRTSVLAQELALLRVQYAETAAKAPGNPGLPAVHRRIIALENQVTKQKAELTGNGTTLASKLGVFEELIVRRDLAEKVYEDAQKRLDMAEQKSRQQQIYIQKIVSSSTPDSAEEPQRLRYVATVALLGLWVFFIFYLLVSGSREHLNLH